MITLTQNAITAIGRYIEGSENTSASLRIEVADGGCSGMQYGLRLEDKPCETDTIIEFENIKVLVNDECMPILDGMTVDFVDSLDGSGFKFTNPNAVKSCACGTSFSTSDDGMPTKTCS